MSIASPPAASAPLNEGRGREPSMDEILASIRRIIADDRMLPLTRTAATRAEAAKPQMLREPPSAQPTVPQGDESAELGDQSAMGLEIDPPTLEPLAAFTYDLRNEQEVVTRMLPRGKPAVESPTEADPIAAQAESAPAMPSEHAADDAAPDLISPDAGASVSSSFQALATTMFLQQTGMVEESLREMLRPMLKTWLDDHLPALVERLVRAEIERVARGSR